MGHIKITITGSSTKTQKLTFDNQQEINAHSGDQVTWVIGTDSGVSSIVKIHEKAGFTDVFIEEPVKQSDGSFMGTCKTVQVPIEEDYYIAWNSTTGGWHGGGSGPYTYDPKIKVNPTE